MQNEMKTMSKHSSILIGALILVFIALSDSAAVKRQRITAPIRLRPGETPAQKPGWTHCVTDMKVFPQWRKLRSPDYPKLAPIQMQCSWILEAPIGWRVMVAFKDLHLTPPSGDGPEKACRTSFIKIIDMMEGKSQGRFCGNEPPGEYVSLGSVLRIDLQGDKSPTPRRGFIITYTMTKEVPGFRAAKKSSSPSDSNPGKVNFNHFKSTQQKLINTASSNKAGPKRKYKIPKRLVYASDTTTLKPTTTTVANEGWLGDVALPKGPSPTNRKGGGAKVQGRQIHQAEIIIVKHLIQGRSNVAWVGVEPRFCDYGCRSNDAPTHCAKGRPAPCCQSTQHRTLNKRKRYSISFKPTNKQTSSGNRVQATNQRGTNTERDNMDVDNAGRIQSSDANDDYWTGVGRNPAPVEGGEIPRIYGQHIQPFDTTPKKKQKEMGENYVVVKKEGLSTEQLIIIIVGVLACVLLVVAVFFFKRFYFDRLQKEEKKEEKSRNITENPYNVNRGSTLPAMSRAPSVYSLASEPDHLSMSRHVSVAPSGQHMTSSRNISTNGGMTRHQTLVAKHEAVYRNHRAQLKNAANHPELNGRSLQRRGSNVNRPLPPLPTENKGSKPNDVDEDYCSGSDEDPDVATMKREMSTWEIEQERRNKIKNRYKL